MRIPFGRPILGESERAATLRVLESPQLVHGPETKAFESAFAIRMGPDIQATSVSSATAGLYLAYAALGVGPGTEVVVPALTHVATAHAAHALGATVRFADVEMESGNVSAESISRCLSSATRAICVVHYLGLPVDMGPVQQLARRHGIGLVEDCALALGTSLYQQNAGTLGDIGVFSFYPAKHMTTGEGGMVVSRDHELMAQVQSMKAFGYDKPLAERTVPGVYDIKGFGLNLRMSEISAAIGVAQLARLEDFASRRAENSERLRANLEQIDGISVQRSTRDGEVHSHYCEVAILAGRGKTQRDRVAVAMQARGIGTSVYYPVPLPETKFYSELSSANAGTFPGATQFSYSAIALPVGPHLNLTDMDIIADALSSSLSEVSDEY